MAPATEPAPFPGMMPPPPGQSANMADPESIAWQLILTCVLCPVVSVILVLVRWYTARVIVQKTYTDDCEFRSGPGNRCGELTRWCSGMIVVAWVFATCFAMLQIAREYCRTCAYLLLGADAVVETRNGVGLHLWDVTPAQFQQFIIVSKPKPLSLQREPLTNSHRSASPRLSSTISPLSS